MNSTHVEDIYPLTTTQQGMLFHALSSSGSVYFEQLSCELLGEIDVAAFERAWGEVQARHPVLRCAVDWESMDQPVQVVLARPGLPFVEHDWRGLAPAAQPARLEEALAADRERGFDLVTAPLVRIALFRLAEQRYRLVWSHHHLILDGWSMPLLFEEFFACYRAAVAGTAPALAPPPRPYRDYIAWLDRQDLAAAELFWRDQLAGFAAPVPLAFLRPQGAGQNAAAGGESSYEERSFRMTPEATAALAALARGHQVTVNSLVEAAWALLLGRCAGLDDLVFGVVVSGRPAALAGVDSMVGLFLNTLPLRLQLHGDEPLVGSARRVQARLTEMLAYEHSPLAEIQGWSEVPRGLPLFESIVVFQNYPIKGSGGGERSGTLPGTLKVHDYRIAEHTNYPLNLLVSPGAELCLAFSFDATRCDARAVEELLRQLRGVLEQAIERPAAPLASCSLITPEAGAWLPDPTLPIPAPFHAPVARQLREVAERWPDAPAVVQGEQSWRYRELAAAAGTLARRLQAAGLAAGEPVAVRGVRSFGLIVAECAVLLAGGALVPLDRTLPDERQRRMLELASVRRVLEVGEPEGGAEGGPRPLSPQAEAIWVSAAGAVAGSPAGDGSGPDGTKSGLADPVDSLAGLADPPADAPAYVFFTSGTTGEPKAVIGRQSGLAHFLDWQRGTFAAGPGDRVAQLTGLSFDVVLREIFLPLTSGAALHLPEEGVATASAEVPAWLARSGITLLHTVPSLAQVWTGLAAESVRLPELRCVFFAGEPLTDELVVSFRSAFEFRGRVINLYGPTETTLAKCWYEVPAAPDPGVQPIGRPLPDTQVLILGPEQRLCGAFEVGEIVVRTPFRTLGLLSLAGPGGNGGFLPNPFRAAEAVEPAAADLLYRSGDLGRYRIGVGLEILGRLDGQLKVRGVRVEPAEVERALRRHPAVRDVVVMGEEGRGRRLTAYVVPRAGRQGELVPEVLALIAREALPEPLVPSFFVFIDELPLTANGKLDRAALRDLGAARHPAGGRFVAPRDPVELELAAIWQELLGVERVGVKESFFTLGGHSLLVAPMLVRVERRFHQKVPLASFLPVPTVERLAATLRASDPGGVRSVVLPIRPQGAGLPLFCVHPLAGSALCYLSLAQSLAQHDPEQPLYGLDEQFVLESGRRFAGLDEMAATYLAALREVRPHGPYLLCGWSFGGMVAFEMAQQLVAAGEEVALLALFDTDLPVSSGAAQADETAGPEIDDLELVLELLGPDARVAPEALAGLTPEEQLAQLVELGRRSGQLPPDFEVTKLQAFLAMVRMNGRLVQEHSPGPFPGRVVFFQAELDGDRPGRPEGNLERWRALAGDGLEVRPVAAHHRSMVYPPEVEALSAELVRCLAEATAARASA